MLVLILKCCLALTVYCAALTVVDGQLLPSSSQSIGRSSSTTNFMLLPHAVKKREEKRGEGEGIDGDSLSTTTATPFQGFNPPDTLRVSSACDSLPDLNTSFIKQGVTADNKPYYQSKDGLYYLYYDKDCSGDGKHSARWIFDESKPSTTAISDLDGDSSCVFTGYISSGGAIPPASAAWQLDCGGRGAFTKVPLTIAIEWYNGLYVCPPGSFCNGDECPSNKNIADIPRDRWDPKKVRAISCLDSCCCCAFFNTCLTFIYIFAQIFLIKYPPTPFFFSNAPCRSVQPAAALPGTERSVHHLPWVQTATASAAARPNIDARGGQAATAPDVLQTTTTTIATCQKLQTIHARSAKIARVPNHNIAWLAPTALTAAPAGRPPVHGGIGIHKPARPAAARRGATRAHRLTSAAKSWG